MYGSNVYSFLGGGGRACLFCVLSCSSWVVLGFRGQQILGI